MKVSTKYRIHNLYIIYYAQKRTIVGSFWFKNLAEKICCSGANFHQNVLKYSGVEHVLEKMFKQIKGELYAVSPNYPKR